MTTRRAFLRSMAAAALLRRAGAAKTKPDSFDVLPALARPELTRLYRDHLVVQAYNKKLLSLRRGPWKLIAPAGKKPELYNLQDDPGEEKNLAKKMPEKVAEMTEELERIKAAGRTRP